MARIISLLINLSEIAASATNGRSHESTVQASSATAKPTSTRNGCQKRLRLATTTGIGSDIGGTPENLQSPRRPSQLSRGGRQMQAQPHVPPPEQSRAAADLPARRLPGSVPALISRSCWWPPPSEIEQRIRYTTASTTRTPTTISRVVMLPTGSPARTGHLRPRPPSPLLDGAATVSSGGADG